MSRGNLDFFCAVVIVGLLAGVAGLATTVVLHFVEHITYHYTFGPLLGGVSGSSPVRRAVGPMVGGALAAVLVGPWTAMLCLSVVLLVQSLLFADGGVSALGTNVLLMGVVGVLVGWLAFRGLQAVLPKKVGLVAPLAAVAAYLSVPVTALAFVGLYAVGGTAPIPLDSLTTAMLGWHAVIGLGEAAITGLVVGSVVSVRPDLCHGARRVLARRTLELRTPVVR